MTVIRPYKFPPASLKTRPLIRRILWPLHPGFQAESFTTFHMPCKAYSEELEWVEAPKECEYVIKWNFHTNCSAACQRLAQRRMVL